MTMSKRQVDKIRKQLEAKLADVNGNSSRRDGLITERSNDPMDEMQSRIDVDLAVRVINTDWRTKRAVETAMALLETGEYGTCQECGDPINPKRLEAIPWTTLCVQCQESHDEQVQDGLDSKLERAA